MTVFTATTPDQIPGPDVFRSQSGLEYMQGVIAGRYPQPTMAGHLGVTLTEIAPGRAVFQGQPDFSHSNLFGAVHGGWYGAVLDSAMGCAVMTTVPKGRGQTTLEFKVNITRALPFGMAVIVTGTVEHGGRSTAVARGEVRGRDDGRLYATASTTCIMLD